MRVVRIDGREWRGAAVPDAAELAARVGPGLIETMRARQGRVAHRELHIARLAASTSACGYREAADPAQVAAALDAVVGGGGAGDLMVRVVAGSSGAVLVESRPVAPLPVLPVAATARVLPGLWDPEAVMDEHKRTERAKWEAAEAVLGDVDVAVAADSWGRLGEASRASVFVVRDGIIRTAPVAGILPGVGRRVILQISGDIVEHAPESELWRAADEIFVVSALRGVTAIVAVDAHQVGDGAPGPVTVRLGTAFRGRVMAETGGEATA